MDKMNTLVIIPTYNEAENIGRVIPAMRLATPQATILVVDDNSPDGTARIVEKLSAADHLVKLVAREKKKGRGSAVLEGIAFGINNGFDLIAEMDADLSHDPADFPKLIEKTKEADVVIGSRYIAGSSIINWPAGRKILSACANRYIRMNLGLPINDCTNGYRVYSRAAAETIIKTGLRTSGHIALSEIAYILFMAGFTFGEIPVTFVNRKYGRSTTNFHEIAASLAAIHIIKNTNRVSL
ncbi:MAG: hypothetical protein A2219_01720 [Elusimicrobia bacterium RIFOXYA2_FULL_50_26]|nr:MAG: hypothetical protein A2219_01720 [Elusimicrobia bacterium RIFOXYA2_FULL_50_26]OGS24128.1 MAG: hypothetical protein A2314_09440 [Elusimicrobia bacterium RIFOXYB2_FULL_50_12]